MLLASVAVAVLVLRLCKGLIESLKPVLLRQLDLVDKMTTIASSHDVMAYQAIQVMDQQATSYDEPYDPSDEAEARREAERHHEDPEALNAEDDTALRQLFN